MYNQAVKNVMSTQDKIAEAARLRDQLRREIIESKKLCSYEPHECRHVRVENYNYCQLHILEDEKAPFKQCAYTYNSTGKKCYMPAAKNDNKLGYCYEHIKRTAVAKNKTTQKAEPPESAETILHSLIHYVKPTTGRHRTSSGNSEIGSSNRIRTTSNSSKEDEENLNAEDDSKPQITTSLDPYSDINATKINASCSEILEYASESESDVEPTVYNNVWHSQNADLSDNESIDSECEDPLKHAEIYTAEEVCSLTRDKLIRLQDLYTEQFRYLQRVLREKRRRYMYALKKEKETLASIHNQVRDNPKEHNLYQKLKFLNSYHKRSGVEAILQKRVNDIRAKLSSEGGATHKQPPFVKCLFTEGGVKCGSRALPHAKHCLKHILNDPMQVLFRACGVTRGDTEMTCHEPVPDVFPGQACVYHTDIPPLRSYTHMKRDEDDLDSSNDTIDIPKSKVPCSSILNSSTVTLSSSLNRLIDVTSSPPNSMSNHTNAFVQQEQHSVTTAGLSTTSVCSTPMVNDTMEFIDEPGTSQEVFDMLKVDDISSNVEVHEDGSVVEEMQLQVEENPDLIVDNELEVGPLE